MISLQIAGQAKLFLYGMVAGMVMLLVYDMLRIWRRVIAHGTVWIALEDIIYWCGSAVGLFLLFYQQNDGKIRFFLLLSAFVGMCLYYKGLSPGILKIGTAVLGSVVKAICFLAKGISRPFVFVVKSISCRWKIKKD